MGIHVEPITAILRAGDELHEYGDPYEFSATIIIRDHRAEIVAGAGKFAPKWRRELRDVLSAWGVTEVVFERRGLRSRTIRMKVTRPVAPAVRIRTAEARESVRSMTRKGMGDFFRILFSRDSLLFRKFSSALEDTFVR